MIFLIAQGQPPTLTAQGQFTAWARFIPLDGEFEIDGQGQLVIVDGKPVPVEGFVPTADQISVAGSAAADSVAEQQGLEEGILFAVQWEGSVAVEFTTAKTRHHVVVQLPDPDGDGVPG